MTEKFHLENMLAAIADNDYKTVDELEQHLIQLELIKEKANNFVNDIGSYQYISKPFQKSFLELKELLQLCQPQPQPAAVDPS